LIWFREREKKDNKNNCIYIVYKYVVG